MSEHVKKYDAFDVGEQVIMTVCLPKEEVQRRLVSLNNPRFFSMRAVGATGKIIAAFPTKNTVYIKVQGVATVMFGDEIAPYDEDVLQAIVDAANPPPPPTAVQAWLSR
jgi:hypothetical protein